MIFKITEWESVMDKFCCDSNHLVLIRDHGTRGRDLRVPKQQALYDFDVTHGTTMIWWIAWLLRIACSYLFPAHNFFYFCWKRKRNVMPKFLFFVNDVIFVTCKAWNKWFKIQFIELSSYFAIRIWKRIKHDFLQK